TLQGQRRDRRESSKKIDVFVLVVAAFFGPKEKEPVQLSVITEGQGNFGPQQFELLAHRFRVAGLQGHVWPPLKLVDERTARCEFQQRGRHSACAGHSK